MQIRKDLACSGWQCLNLHALRFKLFWTSPWNVFDFVIVLASLLVLLPGAESVPFLYNLRLLKPLRIFRLFKRVPSLKALMEALGASIPGEDTYPWRHQVEGQQWNACNAGVMNAFLVLLIVMLIFSILAVEFFRESENQQCALLFKRLDIALFTMFVVATGQALQP